MPNSWYDRFADTRAGGAFLRYTLHGIDRHPTYTQRTLTSALRHSTAGLAYTLDHAYMSYRGLRGHNLYSDFEAEAAPMYTSRKSVGMMNPQEARFHVRGSRSTHRFKRTPKGVKMNYKTRTNLPIFITHEENTEVRAKAGTQAIVQFQAERLFPYSDATTGPTGTLNTSVNRDSAGVIATYNGGLPLNNMMKFTTAAADERTVVRFNHRSDWTMFTNASWRDGYSALNGRFSLTATVAATGYRTPFETDVTHDTAWWQTNERLDIAGAPQTASTPITPLYATDYHHLSESLNVTVTNNATVPTTVTIYECILAHDVQMKGGGQGITNAVITSDDWGALPCPIALWRASKRAYATTNAGISFGSDGAYVPFAANATLQGDVDGEGGVGTRMGVNASAAEGGLDAGGMGAGGGIADIDHQYMTPTGGLLHHWYKLVPHTRRIAPGQTTTIKVKCLFNKRIPGTWWRTLAGKAGYSRTFFMVSRPMKMVGSTSIDEAGLAGPGARMMVMGNTDLTMRWTKSKSFCRVAAPTKRSVYYHAAMPDLDVAAIRNPEDGDMEDEGDGALGGND